MLLQPPAKGDKWTHQTLRELWRNKRQSQEKQQHQRCISAVLIELDYPCSANGRETGKQREGCRHAQKNRQTVAAERLIRAGKDKGKNRQHAGAENGQKATEIYEKKDQHSRQLLRRASSCRQTPHTRHITLTDAICSSPAEKYSFNPFAEKRIQSITTRMHIAAEAGQGAQRPAIFRASTAKDHLRP